MKRIFSLLIIAMVGIVGVAQNTMTVHKKDNSQIAIGLDEFQSTSFDVSNANNPRMVVTKTDNSQVLVPLSDLDHASFDEVSSGVELDYSQLTVTPFRYGYSQLNDTEKAAYDIFYNSIVNFTANAAGGNVHYAPLDASSVGYYIADQNAGNTFLQRMQKDCPELFLMSTYVPRWFNGVYNAQISNVAITNRWTPESYGQMMSAIDAKVKEILVGVYPSMSDIEKIRTLHDNFGYKVHFRGLSDGDAQTIVGGYTKGGGVCQGLAESWLYACQKAGIECIYVSGQLITRDTNGDITKSENHAWNYVKCDGKWYMIDMAADVGFSGITSKTAFLRGSTYRDYHYNLLYQDGTDNNACYNGLPTLEENDYDTERNVINF